MRETHGCQSLAVEEDDAALPGYTAVSGVVAVDGGAVDAFRREEPGNYIRRRNAPPTMILPAT